MIKNRNTFVILMGVSFSPRVKLFFHNLKLCIQFWEATNSNGDMHQTEPYTQNDQVDDGLYLTY